MNQGDKDLDPQSLRLERDRRARVGRGVHQLLGNDEVQLALAALEKRYFDAWKKSKPDDIGTRERAYAFHTALGDLTKLLTAWVDDGILAVTEIQKDHDANARKMNGRTDVSRSV